jgi:hypothetical protein
MADFLIGLTIVSASVGVSLLISVPFTGAVVRLRANYNPKSLQLDEEGVVQPYTGPQITSFFGMLARVKRIEVSHTHYAPSLEITCSQGWPGLYKGFSKLYAIEGLNVSHVSSSAIFDLLYDPKHFCPLVLRCRNGSAQTTRHCQPSRC